MPISDNNAGIASGVISAVGQLGSGLIGSIMQKRENARQREYETGFYNMQKQDNLDFWNMQNQYNTPAMQMQRLKEAGLNPNLIYGNATAGAQSGQIQSPNQGASNSTKVINPLENLNLGGMISEIYDLRQKSAQTNLTNQAIETQDTVQRLNALKSVTEYWEAQKRKTGSEFDRKTYDTRILEAQQKVELLTRQISNVEQQTRTGQATEYNLRANTQKTTDENIRAWQSQKLSLKQMLANINQSVSSTKLNYQNINESKSRELINKIDAEFKRKGISPNSTGISRLIDTASSYGTSFLEELYKNIMDLKSKFNPYNFKH